MRAASVPSREGAELPAQIIELSADDGLFGGLTFGLNSEKTRVHDAVEAEAGRSDRPRQRDFRDAADRRPARRGSA